MSSEGIMILPCDPVFKPQILGVAKLEGLAVALKLSTQAVASFVVVGPAVMKDSKSNLTVQTSEKKHDFCFYHSQSNAYHIFTITTHGC